jgi:exosortase A
MKRDLQLELDPTAAAVAARAAPQWRYAVPVVVFLLLWVLAWYAPTAKSIVDIWDRSSTFAHGYVVPLIVVWLVWRKRDELATMFPTPSWPMLMPVALAGFAWLLGELAAVNVVSQLALTALLVLTVVSVLGTAVARKLAFPLAFLFFSVPVGEALLPYLMTWTADFTVGALRLTGVPVYREGQQLVIPTGVWSVVEACSGLRYLIASTMVGTLFAYVMYRSLGRRLMFVGISILVPIVANWLRAYMIVMIGHLSNNKLAVGVDHLIYGWLFFGVVIGCLFWIGARWREDYFPAPASMLQPIAAKTPPTMIWSAAAATLVLVTVWRIAYFGVQHTDLSTPPRLDIPTAVGEWTQTPLAITTWQPVFVNPAAELQKTFVHGDRKVGLIVSYYRNQNRDSKLVTSENQLINRDDHTWLSLGGGAHEIDIDGKPVTLRTAQLRGPAGQELVVWQWYWVNGRLTANDHWAKAYTALSRLRAMGDDSASVLIYARRERADESERALAAFVQSAGPALEAALQQARNAR